MTWLFEKIALLLRFAVEEENEKVKNRRFNEIIAWSVYVNLPIGSFIKEKESSWQNRGGMLYVVARYFSEVVEWHFYRDIEEPELSDAVLSGEVMQQRHIQALGKKSANRKAFCRDQKPLWCTFG